MLLGRDGEQERWEWTTLFGPSVCCKKHDLIGSTRGFCSMIYPKPFFQIGSFALQHLAQAFLSQPSHFLTRQNGETVTTWQWLDLNPPINNPEPQSPAPTTAPGFLTFHSNVLTTWWFNFKFWSIQTIEGSGVTHSHSSIFRPRGVSWLISRKRLPGEDGTDEGFKVIRSHEGKAWSD